MLLNLGRMVDGDPDTERGTLSDQQGYPGDAYEVYAREALAQTAVSRGYLAVAVGLPLQLATEVWLRHTGYFADDSLESAAARYLGLAALGLVLYGLSRSVPAFRRFPFLQGNAIAFAVCAMLGRAAHHAGGPESPYVVSLCTVLFCWSLIMPGGLRYAAVPIVGGLATFYGVLLASDPGATFSVRARAFALFTSTSAGFALVYAEVLERWRKQVTTSSTTDGLTKVANRASLLERLDELYDEAKANGRAVSVLMIDLDHFKNINDTYGHAIGDDVLCAVASALARARRKRDACGRVGGEEFVLVLDGCDGARAEVVAEELRAEIAAMDFVAERERFRVSVSIGVSTLGEAGFASPRAALGAADRALYESKAAGRNRVTVARP